MSQDSGVSTGGSVVGWLVALVAAHNVEEFIIQPWRDRRADPHPQSQSIRPFFLFLCPCCCWCCCEPVTLTGMYSIVTSRTAKSRLVLVPLLL